MIITLFVLLDVAWDSSDIRNKYHSADVNFVLGEYWHGGISNRIVVSSPDDGGKIFNDDVVVLSSSFVDHPPSTLDDTTTTTNPSSLAVTGGAVGGSSSKERTTLIPPSLSYARSSTSSLYNHGSMKRATRPSLSKSKYSVEREEEQTMASTMAWSLWQAIRAMIWLVFALPVIETAVREIRRRHCISALSTRRTNNSVR